MNQLNDLEVTILERLGGEGVTGLKLGSLGMDRWKMWLQGTSPDSNLWRFTPVAATPLSTGSRHEWLRARREQA
ncbi:MAG: hypothetical protein KF678_15155 [Phycisphaeraceae bacterium]|nr:hypothetical protein [Phycisphaeraceae bacterium]